MIVLLVTRQLWGLRVSLPFLSSPPAFSYCLFSWPFHLQGGNAVGRGSDQPGWCHWLLSPHQLLAVCPCLVLKDGTEPMGILGVVLGWGTGCQVGNVQECQGQGWKPEITFGSPNKFDHCLSPAMLCPSSLLLALLYCSFGLPI